MVLGDVLPTRAVKLQGHSASNIPSSIPCNVRGVFPPHLETKYSGSLACHLGSKLPDSLPWDITSNDTSNIACNIGGDSPPHVGPKPPGNLPGDSGTAKLPGNLPGDSGTKFSRHPHTTMPVKNGRCVNEPVNKRRKDNVVKKVDFVSAAIQTVCSLHAHDNPGILQVA